MGILPVTTNLLELDSYVSKGIGTFIHDRIQYKYELFLGRSFCFMVQNSAPAVVSDEVGCCDRVC